MKASIILPVYNGGEWLEPCLQSISAQTFDDFEIIAVNDGSTDDSLSVLQQYSCREPRLKVFSTVNQGVSAARNLALSKAQGDYIRFVDCDDLLPSDSLRQLICQAEEHNAQLAVAPFDEVLGPHQTTRTLISSAGCFERDAYLACVRQYPRSFFYSVLWNKLYRRELIERDHLAFDCDVAWSEDFLFNMDYLAYVERVAVLDTPVYQYRHHVSGLTLHFAETFVFHLPSTLKLFGKLFARYHAACLKGQHATLREYLLFFRETHGQ